MEILIEQLFNGLAAGAIYALITLGLALIYGVMKILHVAHASVFTVGAYTGPDPQSKKVKPRWRLS